jgi:cysteine desulfurase
MAANHETGVLQPIESARVAAHAVGALFHVDATQAAGRVPLALAHADGVVLSSHKLGGPGGVGCLILRDGEPFPPLLTGGSLERGRRAGTVNVAGVVGFGEACRLARLHLDERARHTGSLSAVVRHGLLALGVRLVGDPMRCLPNTTCAVFPGIRGEAVVVALDLHGICVSSGAACASGSVEASPVLRAMGDPEPAGGVRISLGPQNEPRDVDALLAVLNRVLGGLREEAAWAARLSDEHESYFRRPPGRVLYRVS